MSMRFSVSVIVSIFLLSLKSFAGSSDFYFVQLTDTHWGDGENLEKTKAAITAINNLPVPIEFVVHTGDMTTRKIEDQNLIDSGLGIMKACKYPVYYVPEELNPSSTRNIIFHKNLLFFS